MNGRGFPHSFIEQDATVADAAKDIFSFKITILCYELFFLILSRLHTFIYYEKKYCTVICVPFKTSLYNLIYLFINLKQTLASFDNLIFSLGYEK